MLKKFSSQKNLDMFKSDPEKYAPQFGGYCAYGMGDGDGHKDSAKIFYLIVLAQFCGTSVWFAGNAVLPQLQAQFGLHPLVS